MIDDLAKKEIDIAVAWGPIGGYFAKQSTVPMEVRMVPEYVGYDAINNAKGKEFWNISVGVRKKDKERMEKIQAALDRNADKITKNSPTNPDVPGNPELAIANSTANAAKIGILLTTPP